ncbi:MAG: hypothetical protein ABNH53_02235 [Henriciella sp.]
MADSKNSVDPYKAAFEQFMIEVRFYLGEVQGWLLSLSDGEKILGLCAFVLFLLLMIVSKARRNEDPGSNGRQFSGALVLVMIFAFGTGWTLDAGNGSFAHLFGR